jgi:16S rRNA (cytosine967-C5)-methyltransferase
MDPARAERIYERQADLLVEILSGLQTAVGTGNPLDSHLSRFYHQHPEFGSRDRRLFSGTVFSYFRWKGWLDRIAPTTAAACVFAHLLESAEIHPAILKLAGRAGLPDSSMNPMGPLPPLGKAAELGRITGVDCSLAQLVPAWVIPMLGPDPAPLLEAFQTPPPTWLRVRPENREPVMALLQANGGEPMAHPVISSAVSVRRGINLRALPRPIRDDLDIQDLASQATGVVCNPRPGERWWDACCGSGGKTLHLSALGGPSVSILATDIRATILDELSRRTGEARLQGITTALWDGKRQPPPEGAFDGILLDAPCSGTGTWHRNPDARWRTSPETVAQLINLQSHLLRACATRLKAGGVLVYATCSVTRNENEAVVASFLAESPDFQLSPFINPLDGAPCDGLLRIAPRAGPCNGMFLAKLTRKLLYP